MAVVDPGKLSLQNSVLTVAQLERTPSEEDGIPKALENELRALGCELIQSAGILLRLPQVAMATAQVLLQRYYYMASLKLASVRDIAMGAVFLASKVEETPRKIKDIINVFAWLIDQYRDVTPRVESYAGLQYNGFKDGLASGEMRILCKLGFNVQVQQPHGFMINYMQSLDIAENEELAQTAWNYLNDGLRTNIYVCYQPSTIACAAIFLSARVHKVKLPTEPPWWEVFDTDLEDMTYISGHLLNLYQRPPRKGLPLTLAELESYNYDALPS
ncbi:hypothetical protein PhCBS80983_g02208 [Powellomyces hirtus]|uniref:Cyclin-like domain-containing protein n=1 Tax=Powellomyces hirtus TaxID=109895 RepID=A0A507E911_9FUNG|nr:hypothetical protein PhCBS80983_g02208 [Powellomyces hirtus]